ncbi:unnamed protein product [Prorocentrum cordatum]|uniref:Phospholipid scramblase n=1 Tax=Prorocentrum cordatum TaxID=2364126 RepID=A0ABN9SSY7_9DINO|nr:unnamed protein product [Polarella glacialis]
MLLKRAPRTPASMDAVRQAARAAGLGELVDQAEKAAGCCSTCQGCGGCVDSSFFATVADVTDNFSECGECIGRVAGCFASPLAFPLVYLCPAEGQAGGALWAVSMEDAPLKQPLVCCFSACLPCLVQFWVRRRVLDDDMSRYICFQGRRDGPYCLANCSPGLPFTFTAGTYGEKEYPMLCLCAEATLCTMCAFQVSREVQREDRGLGLDPTEIRVAECLAFFGSISQCLCCAGCCIKCSGCLVGCCLGQTEGAQEFDDSAQRLGNSCHNVANSIHRGMHCVITIAVGCMSAQMVHESYLPVSRACPGARAVGAPQQERMSHGGAAGDAGARRPPGERSLPRRRRRRAPRRRRHVVRAERRPARAARPPCAVLRPVAPPRGREARAVTLASQRGAPRAVMGAIASGCGI